MKMSSPAQRSVLAAWKPSTSARTARARKSRSFRSGAPVGKRVPTGRPVHAVGGAGSGPASGLSCVTERAPTQGVASTLDGSLVARLGQSPVLGELAAGIVIGNLGLFGIHGLDSLRGLAGLDLLAQIGVLFLLFSVGLQSDVKQMMAVGASSFVVAVLGVIAPIGLGYFCSAWFFPHHNPLTHWFVGATLCATSVGITARVLSDLNRTTSTEGRIILGAAVIDDVLGLRGPA